LEPWRTRRTTRLYPHPRDAPDTTNLAFANRFEHSIVWPDRKWERSILTKTPDFETPRRIELDERAQGWYQLVGNGVFPYSAKLEAGHGQWYASTLAGFLRDVPALWPTGAYSGGGMETE
jgi:hypothetical protein